MAKPESTVQFWCRSPAPQYEVSGIGPSISPGQLKILLERYIAHSGRGFGGLTGSTQLDIAEGLYADLVLRIREAGGLPVVDTHHESLRRAIMAKPFFIKPNRHELETLVGCELPTPELVARQARRIQEHGVDCLRVSWQ